MKGCPDGKDDYESNLLGGGLSCLTHQVPSRMPAPWKVLRKRLLSEYKHESVSKGYEDEDGQERRAIEESNLRSYSISTALHPSLTPKVFRRLHGKKGKTETVTLFCRSGQRSFLGTWQWGKCLQWRIGRLACC